MATRRQKIAARLQPGHVEFEQFCADFEQAVSLSTPINGGQYANAAVFAFSFENTNFPIKPLMTELLNIFKSTYHFQVEEHLIPTKDARGNVLNAVAARLWIFEKLYKFIGKYGRLYPAEKKTAL